MEFVVRLVTALAGQVPLLHAVGAPTAHPPGGMGVEEEEQAAWAAEMVLLARRLGVSELYWWTWSDYDRQLWHHPPLNVAPAERTMGLVRADGTPKPALAAIQEALRQPVVPAPPDERLDPNRYYSRVPFDELYQQFVATGRLAVKESGGGEQR
ncbi:MAG: hypothetical protein Q9O62_04740 [Ardenticatenia bacterium]|nr:hypothetical protein [Ardenticatenia bacterium]